jgi:putative methylase
MKIKSKKQLEIILSHLKDFKQPITELEQYSTPSSISSTLLWIAYQSGDIENKVIADLACGQGVFAIGASLLGAKFVYAIDIDKNAIEIARENARKIKNIEFINEDVSKFNKKVDTIIMNPPFGVKKPFADKNFLLVAFKNSNVIYSLHKIESEDFLKKIAEENGFSAQLIQKFDFPIKATMKFHRKRFHKFKVGLWKFEKCD